MNRTLLLLIIIFAMISNQLIKTRIGCLAKSQKLQQLFDTKSYHPVHCSCDCASHQARVKHTAPRNECLECGHFHDPKPFIWVTKIVKNNPNSLYSIGNTPQLLKSLIQQYRSTHFTPQHFDK